MGWNNIKRDAADVAFSRYVRLKAKRCVKCNRRGSGDNGIDGLEASHFWGRGRENTRFSEINVDVLCHGCHKYFGEHKTEYREWKKELLGQKAYDLLELTSNMKADKDRVREKLYWRKRAMDDFGIKV